MKVFLQDTTLSEKQEYKVEIKVFFTRLSFDAKAILRQDVAFNSSQIYEEKNTVNLDW